jgi:DNA replication protein DnaC
VQGYQCHLCKDMKFVYLDVPMNDPRFGKAHPCQCQQSVGMARRSKQLEAMDGLTASERKLRFEELMVTEANEAAVRAVEQAVIVRRGMVTLSGPPGVGKSRLLICAVNAAREANIPAVYAPMTDVLDYLRAAYDPQREGTLSFDARWELLVSAEVLSLDELDEFNTSPWAMERFLRLIDERWRHMDSRLTLLATNQRISALPPKVASRLRDGRSQVISIGGRDMRPLQEWDVDGRV